MFKVQLLYIAFFLSFFNNFYCQNDTISLYYDIGIFKLNKLNYNKIQTKLDGLNANNSYQVEIISSADFLGSNQDNLALSKQRATNVRNLLLIKKNVIITAIKYDGIGELGKVNNSSSNQKGIPSHRKTMLIFKTDPDIKTDNDILNQTLEQLKNAKSGEKFILQHIIFEPGSHLFKKESLQILKKLVVVLKENPNLEIALHGHVCCGKNPSELIDGFDTITETYNLSENRAKHIYNYLVLKK
jgi:outer membrane protein OmpA-like peptidoglycan-associated protein